MHHQHLICTPFDVSLCRLKNPMQFSELLIHSMHMIVQNERSISLWKLVQNYVSRKLFADWEPKTTTFIKSNASRATLAHELGQKPEVEALIPLLGHDRAV